MNRIRVGSRWIGSGEPCYVIAEAGSNHNGSLDRACELIDVAAGAGADAVKFQVFRASRLYPPNAGVSAYLKDATPIYDIIASMETPYEWLPKLADRCRARGVDFLASSFDEESTDRIAPFVPAFKIASYEMNHLPLVRHVAGKGKPLIVSTGTADLDEVRATVDAVLATGNLELILMQCTAAYPAPLDAMHVRVINTLREQFDVPVGLSDHSSDPVVAPVVAVACGASVIEKHFTLSHDMPGPDHRFAVEPDQLSVMIARIRDAETVLGSASKSVSPVEAELRAFARRSIFVMQGVAAGDRLTADNLAILRNGHHPQGLLPDQWAEIVGRRASRALLPNTPLTRADVEP